MIHLDVINYVACFLGDRNIEDMHILCISTRHTEGLKISKGLPIDSMHILRISIGLKISNSQPIENVSGAKILNIKLQRDVDASKTTWATFRPNPNTKKTKKKFKNIVKAYVGDLPTTVPFLGTKLVKNFKLLIIRIY